MLFPLSFRQVSGDLRFECRLVSIVCSPKNNVSQFSFLLLNLLAFCLLLFLLLLLIIINIVLFIICSLFLSFFLLIQSLRGDAGVLELYPYRKTHIYDDTLQTRESSEKRNNFGCLLQSQRHLKQRNTTVCQHSMNPSSYIRVLHHLKKTLQEV